MKKDETDIEKLLNDTECRSAGYAARLEELNNIEPRSFWSFMCDSLMPLISCIISTNALVWIPFPWSVPFAGVFLWSVFWLFSTFDYDETEITARLDAAEERGYNKCIENQQKESNESKL